MALGGSLVLCRYSMPYAAVPIQVLGSARQKSDARQARCALATAVGADLPLASARWTSIKNSSATASSTLQSVPITEIAPARRNVEAMLATPDKRSATFDAVSHAASTTREPLTRPMRSRPVSVLDPSAEPASKRRASPVELFATACPAKCTTCAVGSFASTCAFVASLPTSTVADIEFRDFMRLFSRAAERL